MKVQELYPTGAPGAPTQDPAVIRQLCQLAGRLIQSMAVSPGVDSLREQIEANADVRFMRRRLLRDENVAPDLTTVEDVIRLLGPFTVKEARAIGKTGFDVISDRAYLNVPALQEADELCELFAKIEELNRGRPNAILNLRAGRVSS